MMSDGSVTLVMVFLRGAIIPIVTRKLIAGCLVSAAENHTEESAVAGYIFVESISALGVDYLNYASDASRESKLRSIRNLTTPIG